MADRTGKAWVWKTQKWNAFTYYLSLGSIYRKWNSKIQYNQSDFHEVHTGTWTDGKAPRWSSIFHNITKLGLKAICFRQL